MRSIDKLYVPARLQVLACAYMSSTLKPREVLSVPLFLTLYYLRVQQFIFRMLSLLKYKLIMMSRFDHNIALPLFEAFHDIKI